GLPRPPGVADAARGGRGLVGRDRQPGARHRRSGGVMKHGVIPSPADWRGAEMAGRSDWIHRLSAEEIAEIEQAVASVRSRGIPIGEVGRENFPLKRFPAIAGRAHEYLENGPGMFLIRGLPTERHSVEDMRLAYWGLSKYLGTAVTQSRKGDVLGDVRDLGVFNSADRGRG